MRQSALALTVGALVIAGALLAPLSPLGGRAAPALLQADGALSADACWPAGSQSTAPEGHPQWNRPPALIIDPAGHYSAEVATNFGPITIELFPQDAPQTVNNFVCLALAGFYDGTPVHRVLAGFVIQAGDPTGTGAGGPGYEFADEPITRDYVEGTVAMANAGPDTNGSQFFIALADLSTQLQKNYTIFGRVTAGQETVAAIAAVPTEPGDFGEPSVPTQPVTIERVTITGAAAPALATTVTITAQDIFFEPNTLTIPADTDVTVELVNEGAVVHTFSVDALGISVDLAPGESASVTIDAPAGEYEFYCNVPGHSEAGMVGTLTVAAAGEATPVPAGGPGAVPPGTAPDPDGTPEAAALDIPPPWDCAVEPVGVVELLELAGEIEAAQDRGPGSVVVSSVATLPDGPPADPADLAGVEATLYEFVACVNANDVARLLALHTEEFQAFLLVNVVLQRLDELEDLEDELPLLIDAIPAQGNLAAFAVERAWYLSQPDEIMALVTQRTDGEGQPLAEPRTFVAVFVRTLDEENDVQRWLIDYVALLDE